MTGPLHGRLLEGGRLESAHDAAAHAADGGERFGFGRNWARFLQVLNEDRIIQAERSLAEMIGPTLAGRTFLDIGSGSGLFSLAAVRLGAARVHSFDYDPQSVACTTEVRRRFAPTASNWTVERGDILHAQYMSALGTWEVVYSWGVLHHTGDLWQAVDAAADRVTSGGLLYIALYNDQGGSSKVWHLIKKRYQQGPIARGIILGTFIPHFAVLGLIADLLSRRPIWRRYRAGARGMSAAHDWVDWLGGFPFEVAKPEEVFEACRARGLRLERLRTVGGRSGCNEFVFARSDRPST